MSVTLLRQKDSVLKVSVPSQKKSILRKRLVVLCSSFQTKGKRYVSYTNEGVDSNTGIRTTQLELNVSNLFGHVSFPATQGWRASEFLASGVAHSK